MTTRDRAIQDIPLGRRRLIEAVDSPYLGDASIHPGYPGSILQEVRFNITFSAYCCLWTNANGDAGVTQHAAERLYSAILKATWKIRAEWTIHTLGIPSAVGTPTIAVDTTKTYVPPSRAQDAGVEVREPTGLGNFAVDARN